VPDFLRREGAVGDEEFIDGGVGVLAGIGATAEPEDAGDGGIEMRLNAVLSVLERLS
jgi:hypothetical protein